MLKSVTAGFSTPPSYIDPASAQIMLNHTVSQQVREAETKFNETLGWIPNAGFFLMLSCFSNKKSITKLQFINVYLTLNIL